MTAVRSTPEMPRALAESFESLLRVDHDETRARRDRLTAAAIADLKQAQEAALRHSRTEAQHRFERADEIVQIARLAPRFIDRTLERHLPWMPATLDRIAAERVLVERIFGMKETVPDPCVGTRPLMTSVPAEWIPGQRYTIIGANFGATQGSVTIDLGTGSPSSIAVPIVSWAANAVTVDLPPAAPAGLPLRVAASLDLTRGDAACSDRVSIVYLTPYRVLFATSSVSRWGSSPRGGYSAYHVFTGPQMPALAEPMVLLGSDYNLSWTSSQFVTGEDDPPGVTISSGPWTTDDHRRTLTVHITDDWAWNYTVTVDFHIRQPFDIPIAAGWTSIYP